MSVQCPDKSSKCNFCLKRGHFERACRLKTKNVSRRSLNAVDISEAGSSDNEYEHTYFSQTCEGQAREVLANVIFHTKKQAQLQGKVDTGAMVTCMPLSMIEQIGLCLENFTRSTAQLRGVTGADLSNRGELRIQVTCNDITENITVMVTEFGSDLILGLDFCKLFNLVTMADVCIQRQISVEQQVEAVHIMDESKIDYIPLKRKWSHYLPLGKNTGDPLEDLKLAFPDMFDETVGLFDGEVDLKLSPEAKPVKKELLIFYHQELSKMNII